MENETTTTEVQPAEAEIPEQTGQVASQPDANEVEKSGAQKRIDELTKKFREQERRSMALEQQNQELMTTLTQTVAQMSQRAPQEQLPEIDVEEKRKFEYLLSPIQKQLQAVTAQLAVANVHGEVQAVTKRGTPPEVAQHAAAVLAGWKQRGIPGTAQDALKYAFGEYVMNKGDEEQEVVAQQRSFNKGAATVQTSQGGGGTRRGSATKQLTEAEVEALSPAEQIKYFGSRIGDDVF